MNGVVRIAALGAALVLAGCMSVQRAVEATSDNVRTVATLGIDRVSKLAPFIDCLNRVDLPLHRAVSDYAQAAVPAKGDSLETYNGPGSIQIDPQSQDQAHSAYCIDGLRTAVAARPRIDDLDESGTAYANQLEKLLPTIGLANAYYAEKNFKDDGFAKAREFRAVLGPGFAALFKISDRMRPIVERENARLKAGQLASIDKGEGHSLRWHSLRVMISARALYDAGHVARVSDSRLNDVLSSYSQAFNAASDYAVAHRTEGIHTDSVGDADIRKDGGWFYMRGSAERFLSDAKELHRSLRDRLPAADVQTIVKSFGDDFSSLQDNYNLAAGNSGSGVGQLLRIADDPSPLGHL